jgi:hypothetical protein
MEVLVGDFNGDGKTDVMKFDVSSSGSGQNGLWVGLSDGSKFNTSQWGTWTTTPWMKVLSGNFTGDRKYSRPVDDVMKFDVPAPVSESEKTQCKYDGGIWVDLYWVSYCDKVLATISDIGQTLINPVVQGYKIYFGVVGGGVTTRDLPDYVVQRLTGHFNRSTLDRVMYGASQYTSSGMAMTDCDKIYFPEGQGYVIAIKDGRLFEKNTYGNYVNKDKIRLLLHELFHVQQCIDWYGRENYADMWYGQLARSTFVELFTNTRNVSPRTIHNAMPMEDEAEDNAKTILDKL